MPLRQFVWLNRFVIKVTHFPLLFCIYVYERYFLAPSMYDATDLVENPGRGWQRAVSLADPASRAALFSPNVRVREGSVVGFQKDRALEEVFRRAPDLATLRTQRRHERRKTQNAIRTWMDQHEGEYANSPRNYSTIDSRSVNEWQRKLSVNRDRSRRFRHFSDARSFASDPADLMSNAAYPMAPDFYYEGISRRDHAAEVHNHTDADGDDELVTNDEEEEDNATNAAEHDRARQPIIEEEETFATPIATRFGNLASTPPRPSVHQEQKTPASPRAGPSRRRGLHNRTMSTNTILYAPQEAPSPRGSPAGSLEPASNITPRPPINRHIPADSSPAGPAGHPSPRRSLYTASRPQPVLPARDVARTAFNRSALLGLDIPARQAAPRRRSSVDQDPSSELNAAMAADDTLGAVPSSFATQMALAMTPHLNLAAKSAGAAERDSNNRMSRLMLAKMKTLEESLGDVVREMRVLRSAVPSTAQNSGDDGNDGRKGTGLGPGLRYRVGSGSTSGSAGPALIEVAAARERRGGGLRRSKTTAAARSGDRRPASRRSLGEERVGMGPHESRGKSKDKGKGKAVEMSETDDNGDDWAGLEEDTSFTRRGSSF